MTEAEAVAKVDEVLGALGDAEARERVLAWARSKYGAKAAVHAAPSTVSQPPALPYIFLPPQPLPAPTEPHPDLGPVITYCGPPSCPTSLGYVWVGETTPDLSKFVFGPGQALPDLLVGAPGGSNLGIH